VIYLGGTISRVFGNCVESHHVFNDVLFIDVCASAFQ
jgi:hypothetical protein